MKGLNCKVIAVGGMHGSGTRVATAILMEAGIDFGSDQNNMLDNMFFSRTFNYPAIIKSVMSEQRSDLLRIFDKWMLGNSISAKEMQVYLNSTRNNLPLKRRTWKMLKLALKNGLRKISPAPKPSYYGWKEPLNQILLSSLNDYFSALKYIHVFRDGMDMAYSSHTELVYYWAGLHELEKPNTRDQIPWAMANYWMKTQQDVLDYSRTKMQDRILFVSLEKLCDHPESEGRRIAEFAGITPDDSMMDRIKSIPKHPRSLGRHKSKDLTVFTEAQLTRLKTLQKAMMTEADK